MRSEHHYDIIIIGSGAGGGTIAHQLAPSGRRILLLERGDFVPREPDNWSSRAAVLDEKYHAPEKWFDSDGKPFSPGTHYNVGGNTKFYGAALFRMREEDFGEIRHHGGLSPAWPISYEDLEPYYTQAEWLYEVRGERGNGGGDPTEPWSSAPYPAPAISHEPRMQQLHEHFTSKGLKPFNVPLGVRLNENQRNESLCVRCATCDGYPCLVNAKSDAQTICVQPAMRHGNVTLLTGARALQLTTSATGSEVKSVLVERHGKQEEYTAGFVIVSCGAVNSAALLLRSTNDKHPRGLANSSDCIGRHYMAHNNSVLFMFSRGKNPTLFQKTLAVNDFYHASSEWEFPMGHISMVGKFDGNMFKTGAPRLAPIWMLNLMGRHSLDFWITSEDLPLPDNRVTLDANGQIKLGYSENNMDAHHRLIKTLRRLLKDFDGGWNFFKGGKVPLAGAGHQCGTLRFGCDPATSVLDVHCKAHDLDNLYVVDGSFFPSSSAVNPALTIMANALRVGEHILDRLGVSQQMRQRHVPAARLPVVA
jgi:choline dehydrogenase-like flavoprotein